MELADAYLTFARDGQRVEPFAIAKVETSSGATVYEAHPATAQAMRPDTAHLVDHVLQSVIDHGTGTAAKLDRPVAGKTGTTENNADAWFAGYTPDYAAVVWMGYPDGSRPMDNVHGVSVSGGTLPAKMWHAFMSDALTDVPPDAFPDPPPQLLQGAASSDAPTSVDTSTEDTTSTEPSTSTTTSSSTTTTEPTSTTSSSTTTTAPRSTTSTTATTKPP